MATVVVMLPSAPENWNQEAGCHSSQGVRRGTLMCHSHGVLLCAVLHS